MRLVACRSPIPEEVEQFLALWGLDSAGVDRCRAILRQSPGRRSVLHVHPVCIRLCDTIGVCGGAASFSASSSRRRDCLGEELPTAAYEEIQRFILEKLRSFPTSISQDESILRSGPTTNKLGFTLRLSPNERCGLHRCRQYNRSLTRCVRLQVCHQVSPDAQASAC